MITLQNWRERMRADMGLRDYRPRTREGYELATRLFLDWAKTEPGELTEEHVRAYRRPSPPLTPSSASKSMPRSTP